MKAISDWNHWTNNASLKNLLVKAPFGMMLQNMRHVQIKMRHL